MANFGTDSDAQSHRRLFSPKDENLRADFEISPDNLSKSGLTSLGIEQHYHFTAHITLGYFGELSP